MGADARGIDEVATYFVDQIVSLFAQNKPEPKEMSHVVAGSNSSFAVSTDRLSDTTQQVSKSAEAFHNPETPKISTTTTISSDVKVLGKSLDVNSHRDFKQESQEAMKSREIQKKAEATAKADKMRRKFVYAIILPRK